MIESHKSPAYLYGLLVTENGASPNVVVEDGFKTHGGIIPGDSVTILAARTAFPDHLEWVLKFGGDPNITDQDFRETPIHAVLGSMAPLDVKKAKIELLARAGADLNHMCVGRPPVMKSFNMNGPKIVLQLIEVGADPTVPADNGLMRLVHLVAGMQPPYPDGFHQLCAVLEGHGESIAEAKKDIERWNSFNRMAPEQSKRLRDFERSKMAEARKNRLQNAETVEKQIEAGPSVLK